MIYDRIINVSCVSLTPLGWVFKIRHFFLHVFSDNARAESPKAPSTKFADGSGEAKLSR